MDGKKIMMDLKFVFTVSLVAIMAVTAANADIASTTYYTAGSNISISEESNGKKTISAPMVVKYEDAVGGETRPVYVGSNGQATVVKGTSVPVGVEKATDDSTTWASIWIEE